MRSHCVIPVHEFFDGVECVSVLFIGVKPSLDFAVGLWVFYSCKNLFDAVGIKVRRKFTFAVVIVGELTAVVADTLQYCTVCSCLFHAMDALLCCGRNIFK